MQINDINKSSQAMLDHYWMKLAFEASLEAVCRAHPNPPVGAVIVKDNKFIASGATSEPGKDHAEIVALKKAGQNARGATLYVTLEPCSFFGRTPPCSLAIGQANISRVLIAQKDLHPRVQGQGIQQMRQAGIQVDILAGFDKSAMSLFHPFFRSLGLYDAADNNKSRGIRPEFIMKAALTADGFMASKSGSSQWISSAGSRYIGHRLRSMSDAILVGAGTVRYDDPMLTTRLDPAAESYFQQMYFAGSVPEHDILAQWLLKYHDPWPCARTPVRVVLDPRLIVSRKSKIVQSASQYATVFFYAKRLQQRLRHKINQLENKGVETIPVRNHRDKLDLMEIANHLLRRGVLRVLVEGGANVHTGFWNQGFYDRYFFFYGTKMVAGSAGKSPILGKGHLDMNKARALPNAHSILIPDKYLSPEKSFTDTPVNSQWNHLLMGTEQHVYRIS